ncbi:MAG: ABC transporter ATP-binding protein [Dehalococcoidales bacterium]|nr:ABC transporter ATP-binding protein [Dehalococcoidales bacterium]
MIRLENIKKVYPMGKRELTVLHDINMSVEEGELVAIMGPSGSGKSTLLNLLGCLDKPTSGEYYLEGKEVSRLRGGELADVRGKKIGFIFQTFNLLTKISALANVELGMAYSSGVNRKAAIAALESVGLGERIHHKPTELSGGEQQRVAIARALVKDPAIFLADEPTGQLDSQSGKEIISILTALNTEQGKTVLMVTHDSEIAGHCQRIIRIRDGQIETEGNS